MIDREGLSQADLSRLAVGDLGGIFLSGSPEGEERLKPINDRWKGATEEHIRDCARRAAPSGPPGVILAAIGSRKAKVVRECVRRGLVNQLIIDRDLAEAILKL